MATIHEIAKLVGASAPLAANEILCVSSIEAATSSALVFATDSATLAVALKSPAGAILTRPALLSPSSDSAPASGPPDARLLAVADPRYAFALAARFLRSRESIAKNSAPRIHPTAVLGADVRLGQGSSIGPHAVLGDGVVLGEECEILASVTIYAGTTLGNGVLVQAGAVLGATGFGYARNSASGEYIAFPQQGQRWPSRTMWRLAQTPPSTAARWAKSTRICAGTKIDNLVHIAHNCVVGRNVVIASQTGISGSCVIEDGAVLGGQVGLGEQPTSAPASSLAEARACEPQESPRPRRGFLGPTGAPVEAVSARPGAARPSMSRTMSRHAR